MGFDINCIASIISSQDLSIFEIDIMTPKIIKLVLLANTYPIINNIVKDYLIYKRHKINKANGYGWTVMHHLTSNGFCNTESLKLLIENGASVNLQTSLRNTPTHLLHHNDISMFKILLEYDASTIIKNRRNVTILDKNPNFIDISENIKVLNVKN